MANILEAEIVENTVIKNIDLIIYTKDNCRYCELLKQTINKFNKANYPNTFINIIEHHEYEMSDKEIALFKSKHSTWPQVYSVEGDTVKHIGGYTEFLIHITE